MNSAIQSTKTWAEDKRTYYAMQWKVPPAAVVLVLGASDRPCKKNYKVMVENPTTQQTYTVFIPQNPLEGYRRLFLPQLALNALLIGSLVFAVSSRSQVLQQCPITQEAQ